MRTITCWWWWRAVFSDDGSFRLSTIVVLRATTSLSRRRSVSPSCKTTRKEINKRTYSQVQTVLRGCLACWLGTGDSPVSHATAVVALRLLGATGMGDDLVGHVDKAWSVVKVGVLQADLRL